MDYFQLKNFEKGHTLPLPLSIIKSSIINSNSINGITFESEGYLFDISAIVICIRVAVPSRSPIDIQKYEKIAIGYSDQPPCLHAIPLRNNFPLISHLLSLPIKNTLKELCLFEELFIDEMYNKSPLLFVQRVVDWLNRASSGYLHLDEQAVEPANRLGSGYLALDSETYERIINGESKFELSLPQVYNDADFRKKSKSKSPYIVLCLKTEPVSNQSPPEYIYNLSKLYEFLKDKCGVLLDKELQQYVKKCYTRSKKNVLSKKLKLIIVIPRINSKEIISVPEIIVFHIDALLSEIGLSLGFLKMHTNKKNREIKYMLQSEYNRKEQKIMEIKVFNYDCIQPFNPKLAREMADVSKKITEKSFSVIGLGAIGSQIALNLVRQGFVNWRLIDGDILLPHNLSRHALSGQYKGYNKANAVKNEINQIFEKATISVDTEMYSPSKSKKLFKSDIVLDCSASRAVFLDLAYEKKNNARVFSMYCCGKGYVSVLICEDSARQIRIDDIDLQLNVKGLENNNIQKMFQIRKNDKLTYSTSCNNTTTIMPQDLVSIHSGIISRQIKNAIQNNQAQVFINIMFENDYNVNVEFFVPSSTVIKYVDDWQFRISNNALLDMKQYRNHKLPNETGGVLIGWINFYQKIIYIGKVLPSPPDSEEKPASFIRGKQGLHEQVEHISQVTNNDLYYIGEWHSHGNQIPAVLSVDDIQCMKNISDLMLEKGMPGILVIIGDHDKLGCFIKFGGQE